MLKIALAGVRSHARRLVATVLAAMLGVGFVVGTLIFGDTTKAGYYETFARMARGADAIVSKPSPEQVSRIRTLSTVEDADARMVAPLPLLDRQGRPVTNFGVAGVGVTAGSPPALRPFDLEGHLPQGAAEALLDKQTAAHLRFAIGDEITVLDPKGRRFGYRVSGLMDFGVAKTLSGSSVVGLSAAELTRVTGVTDVQELVVSAKPGVTPGALVESLRTVVGQGNEVVTGEQRRTDLANQATSVARQLTFILLIFGAISLVVAVFVIYNTFAILLAQRIRETALLRCVGASRRQILGGIVVESVFVGLAGGAAGVGLGVAVAHLIPFALNTLVRSGIPVHDVIITPASVLIGLGIGLAATVAAATIPALRATRVTPLAALRDLPVAAVGRVARPVRKLVTAAVLASLGIAVTVLGWREPGAEAGSFIIAAGGVVVFLGVLVSAPLFVGRLAQLIAAPLRRAITARLAVANARRNPGRSAVTAAALMIGVGLMALFSVLIASIERTAAEKIAENYPVDYVISGIRNETDKELPRVPAAVAAELGARSEFTTVMQARVVPVMVGGQRASIGALRPGGGEGVLLTRARPWTQTVNPGDTVTVSLGGKDLPVTVTGLADTEIPSAGVVDLLVPWQTLESLAGQGDDTTVMVKARDDVSALHSRDILDSLRDKHPLIEISSQADLADDLEGEVDRLLGLFGGLLGMTVLIALFGIANTMSLAVVERTRESALMRAIGLSRWRLRVMLLLEAVVMGVVASLVGTALGLFFGRIIMLKAMGDIGAIIVFPWLWLAVLIAAAALASALAAVLPARRAAGVSIVSAMSDT